MNEKDAYVQITDRTLDSSETLADKSLQETSGFYTYHAFESMGGALCSHFNRTYPRAHDSKINQFIAVSAQVDQNLRHSVSKVATILDSCGRNNFLYPNPRPDGNFDLPQDKLTKTDAKDMLKRVKGILKRIKKIIS